MNAEETKKEKARQLRYKKPIAKNLNFDFINQDLWDIQDTCEEVRWYTDTEEGEDSLINALAGEEDEAYEFKMAFADLCAECERMRTDLEEEWVPECFDIFFVAMGQDDVLGWDSYEGDYFGITAYESNLAENESKEKLKKMTKDELIEASKQCFRVYQAYVGLRNRFDNLKAAIDILRNQNTGYLQIVKEIERIYTEAQEQQDDWAKYSKGWKEFERYTNALPQEAWLA